MSWFIRKEFLKEAIKIPNNELLHLALGKRFLILCRTTDDKNGAFYHGHTTYEWLNSYETSVQLYNFYIYKTDFAQIGTKLHKLFFL